MSTADADRTARYVLGQVAEDGAQMLLLVPKGASLYLKTASGKLMENITHWPPVVPPVRQSNRDDSCKRDIRPKLSGWIPGPVQRRCSGCDEKYTGDVNSKSCADCAYGCREAVSA